VAICVQPMLLPQGLQVHLLVAGRPEVEPERVAVEEDNLCFLISNSTELCEKANYLASGHRISVWLNIIMIENYIYLIIIPIGSVLYKEYKISWCI
jgi:hypothetical protein